MSSCNPGDFLECIEADNVGAAKIEVRQIYVCEDVLPADYFKQFGLVCTLHGADCSGGGVKLRTPALPFGWHWCSLCFTPLYRPKFKWEDQAKSPIPPGTPEEPTVKRVIA